MDEIGNQASLDHLKAFKPDCFCGVRMGLNPIAKRDFDTGISPVFYSCLSRLVLVRASD